MKIIEKTIITVPSEPDSLSGSKTRVAAYCRVSTRREEQHSSLENQQKHYQQLIDENPDWTFVGIYSDNGISGTSMANRKGLESLIRDCREHKVDLIITKSISRFARNLTDCLQLVRLLGDLNISIFFEKENIFSAPGQSEFLLTVLSSIAEIESQSISSNVRWSTKKRMESGTFRPSRTPYGYRQEKGVYKIIPEEAAIVKEIFDLVLRGKGTITIAKELNARHIPTGTIRRNGEPGIWTASHIQDIICNPVYIGDLLLQKTYTDTSYQRKTNRGEKDQYYNSEHHEPIIHSDVFHAARAANQQRGREKGIISSAQNRTIESVFSAKVFCGHCGSLMKRVSQSTSAGKRFHYVCRTHFLDPAACPQKRVSEESIRHTYLTMLNKLTFSLDFLLKPYIRELKADPETEDLLLQAAISLERELQHREDPLFFDPESFKHHVTKVSILNRQTFTFSFTCGLVLTETIPLSFVR